MTEVTITAEMIEYPWPTRDQDYYLVTLANGERYKIEFKHDIDSTPDDADCYSERDKQLWLSDNWYYVGVIVTPLDVPERVQFELSDSLWGLEFDFPLNPPQVINGRTFRYTDADYQIMHYPVPDMIGQVQFKVKEWDKEQAVQNYIYG